MPSATVGRYTVSARSSRNGKVKFGIRDDSEGGLDHDRLCAIAGFACNRVTAVADDESCTDGSFKATTLFSDDAKRVLYEVVRLIRERFMGAARMDAYQPHSKRGHSRRSTPKRVNRRAPNVVLVARRLRSASYPAV